MEQMCTGIKITFISPRLSPHPVASLEPAEGKLQGQGAAPVPSATRHRRGQDRVPPPAKSPPSLILSTLCPSGYCSLTGSVRK